MEGSERSERFIVPEEGYTIAENRSYIAVQALRNGSDYLLMADDDMTFDPTLLDDLIADNKDIIGVAYHPRTDMGDKLKWLDDVVREAAKKDLGLTNE